MQADAINRGVQTTAVMVADIVVSIFVVVVLCLYLSNVFMFHFYLQLHIESPNFQDFDS